MLPFTQEILNHTGSFGAECIAFEAKLRDEIIRLVMTHDFAKERVEQAKLLLEVFPHLRADGFEASYDATVSVMKLLYELSQVIPAAHFDSARRGEEDTALYRLFFKVKPAPAAVVVNDWLCDVMWDKPSSLITYSEDEGRFHLVRPNSQGRLSTQMQFLGTLYKATNTWSQFKRIREVVALAEQLYREGKPPATRGAYMEAFKDW